ncbi:MAG: hypothetical protein IKF62_29830, partial [Bosea sp.]|nr:hypothetical protein [Bosea sp. (in: a-proteobacteria)]
MSLTSKKCHPSRSSCRNGIVVVCGTARIGRVSSGHSGMRQSRFSALLLALALVYPAAAQTRVAPPTAVESTPLAAPPGTATPAQNAQPAQQAPTQNQGNQPTQAEPQPVQPP